MVTVFPTGRFAFGSKEVNIERQTLKGGTSLSGEQDVVSADGGGRVFAEFGSGQLVDREQVLAWRALLTILEEGVTRIIVPFCDIRHTPYGVPHRVPHSDQTPFDDDSLYDGGKPDAHSLGGADLRATTLSVALTAARPLLGGEWFSIEHATKGWRAYRVATVDGNTITFRPPLREAISANTVLEFGEPRCLMVQDAQASAKIDYGRYGEAAIRFVEAP